MDEVGTADYYSPQAISSRMFVLDLQVANLKAIVRMQQAQLVRLEQLLDAEQRSREPQDGEPHFDNGRMENRQTAG